MAAEEEETRGYRWESGYEKTWEAIKEDDDGGLESAVAEIIHQSKRKRHAKRIGKSRLGMMRHLYLILDCSENMLSQDLKPTRLLCMVKILEGFIDEFFDQNPISQMGIIITRNKRAEMLSQLAGNPRAHIRDIQQLRDTECIGEASLQNSLELALRSLKHLPSHASREIIFITGSLTTCDPGNVLYTIQNLAENSVRCSVLALAAEVHVFRKLCRDTGGKFNVVLDDCHFRDELMQHIIPVESVTSSDAALIKMGFPHHMLNESEEAPITVCMCHADVPGTDGSSMDSKGYFCPQCLSKYCELPVECKACGLTLVSAPHLARSYHHLFPIDNFKELVKEEVEILVGQYCHGCQKKFTEEDKHIYKCEQCNQEFCVDCDLFIHETLHTCPGCAVALKLDNTSVGNLSDFEQLNGFEANGMLRTKRINGVPNGY